MYRKTWIVCTAAALAAWSALADTKCVLARYATLPVTMSGTSPIITGTVNGVPARFVADSGAFFSMLTQESAARFKLRLRELPDDMRVVGIGGTEQAYQAHAKDFTLDGFGGGASLHNVDFVVGGNAFADATDGVIGQNVLGYNDSEFDLANGAIRLFHAKGCGGAAFAYWPSASPVGMIKIDEVNAGAPHAIGEAKLNGTTIRVMFDTGASRSLLSLRAATRAGFRRDDPATIRGEVSGGVGSKTLETWIARFDLLDLGGEQIRNARLRVGDRDLGVDVDMLLGADFFLSHRLYISHDQHRIYFTYNGGHVFDLRTQTNSQDAPQGIVNTAASADGAGAPDAASAAAAVPGAATPGLPADASGFRRRGAASASRGDLHSALADLDEAVKRDPLDAENYHQRGLVRWRNGQPVLAMDDFDQVLKLSPANVEALLLRGSLRLQNGAKESAGADFAAATAAAPADAGVSLRIAGIYSGEELYPEAIAHLDSWISANKDDNRLPQALNDRCWARAMTGQQLDLALADCNAALKKGPRNSAVLDSRGMVWLRQGDFAHAIADYQDAIALQPKSPWSLYGLGIAELRKGLTDKGNQHLQAATALSPEVAAEFGKLGLSPQPAPTQ
jgi:tetratricopeptide (TPR) repeat protein/predicted aspartyl protease